MVACPLVADELFCDDIVVVGATNGGGAIVAVPLITPFDSTLPFTPFWKPLLVPIKECRRNREVRCAATLLSVCVVPGAGLIGGVVTSGAGMICVAMEALGPLVML